LGNQLLKIIASTTVSNPEAFNITILWSSLWSSGQSNFGEGNEIELLLLSVGEKTLTATLTDEIGNKTELTTTFTVTECDFGFGMWGDKLDVIQRSETGTYKGNNMGTNYHWLGDGWDRYYTFSDNKLTFGMKLFEYTPKVMQPAQYAIAWTLHESWVSELKEVFGEPIEMATYVKEFTGDATNDGLALLNGGRIEMKFSNDITSVMYNVYRKTSSAYTVVYEIKYSQKIVSD
jgi:hypothetical protein